MKNKKFFLGLCFFYVSVFYAQNRIDAVSSKINQVLEDSFFSRTQIAIDVFDLTSGEKIYQKNEKLLLKPASNMKILTTATALYFLGPEYNFETTLWINGEIEDSVLLGDVYFLGGFDPDFTSDNLNTMIYELKKHGIKQIAGNVCLDVSNTDSLFWGEGWMWDDEPSTDFPYLNSFVVNDNAVSIIYKPSEVVGEPAKIQFLVPNNFDVINNSVTTENGKNRLRITRDWVNRNNTIIVDGKISKVSKEDTTSISIFYPNEYLLFLINHLMQTNNISVEGEFLIQSRPETAQLIFSFMRPFSEVIVNLNKQSDNLSAEMTLRALAFKKFSSKTTAKDGLNYVDSLISIVGLEPNDYRLADGSGVSHYNLVTTELLNSILKFFYYQKPELFKILYDSFPVASVDGTLKGRMKNSSAANNVHAKTGTLSGVSSLSGYLTSKTGRMISFSIMEQNYVQGASKARQIQDIICNILIDEL